jgi:hypothetical protein
MPRFNHRPNVKTFEEFVAEMKKESEFTQRYFYAQIQFAEKERLRLQAKDQRARDRKKAAALANAPSASAELPAAPPAP